VARFGQVFKDRVVVRLLPPESAAIRTASQEMGVSVTTLEAVIATAAMDDAQRSACCREQSLFPADLQQWRHSATAALSQPEEGRASPQEKRDDRRRINELERDLRRKEKALAKTAALLVLSNTVEALFQVGTMISLEDRQNIASMIEQARREGARLKAACEVGDIDARTLQHWETNAGLQQGDARPRAVRPVPALALSPTEREQILRIANEPRFAALPAARIVPTLADEGAYSASESSFSRVLAARGQTRHRGRASVRAATDHPCCHRTAPGLDVGYECFADGGARSLVCLVLLFSIYTVAGMLASRYMKATTPITPWSGCVERPWPRGCTQ
jgi:putative transposase